MRPTIHKLPFDPGATYSYVPACCLHYPKGDVDLTKKWVDRVASDPNAFTILLGDQFDLARTHYRKHILAYGVDANSQEAIDDLVRGQVRELADMLDPIKSKIVGVLRGNHVWDFSSGVSGDQYLADLLGIPYLGVFSLFRVEFRDRVDDSQRIALRVLAHHTGGCRGSRTQGGDVSALARMEDGFEADIYTAGHTHRRHSFKIPKLTIPSRGEPIPREKGRVFIRAGAFLKGYDKDEPTTTTKHTPHYAEEAMYAPTDLGFVECEITFKQVAGQGYEAQYKLGF